MQEGIREWVHMLGQCRELLRVTLAVRPTFIDGDEVRRKRSFTDDCTGDFGGRGRIVASRIFLHTPGKTKLIGRGVLPVSIASVFYLFVHVEEMARVRISSLDDSVGEIICVDEDFLDRFYQHVQ